MKRFRIIDRTTESLVYLAGVFILLLILAISYYLVHESGPAFTRKFS